MSMSAGEISERHAFSSRLNWLRAGVLGANDGIVSIAALVVGVAAATNELMPVLIAGVSGVVAGAISMGLGEYVSVSSQRDSERAIIAKERAELISQPEHELLELRDLYMAKGVSKATALKVAEELTAHDPIAAHLDVEYNIDEQTLTNPWHAAISSALSFIAGAILPMAAATLLSADLRIGAIVIASLVALAITGGVGAKLGGAPIGPAVLRVTVGGALALAVTWGIGTLLGVTVV
jgi:VIT1/CCC1 family predicted Fe2+/Mn2+ transporter